MKELRIVLMEMMQRICEYCQQYFYMKNSRHIYQLTFFIRYRCKIQYYVVINLYACKNLKMVEGFFNKYNQIAFVIYQNMLSEHVKEW